MGDLRNKQRKEIEQERIRLMQAEMASRHPPPSPPRCRCDLTPPEVPAMWVINGDERWAPPDFRCPACLPAELKGLLADRPQAGEQ
jgi:hypothetical protein